MGIPMPERYKSLWDPYVALAFVAARTDLVVGTSVSLVAQHDAIALAKAIATLDVLSGGRLVLGVGYGWNREEFEDHGYSRVVLRDVVREKVALMRNVWTDEVASFEGEHVSLSASWSWPKPVQDPFPVLLGVPPSRTLFGELVSWADGWITMGMPTARSSNPRSTSCSGGGRVPGAIPRRSRSSRCNGRRGAHRRRSRPVRRVGSGLAHRRHPDRVGRRDPPGPRRRGPCPGPDASLNRGYPDTWSID